MSLRHSFPLQSLRSGRNQSGFLLESLGLVLLILSLVALLEMNRQFEKDLDAEAVRRGKALATVRNIANDYLVSYSSQLLALPDLSYPIEVDIGGGNMVAVEHAGTPVMRELVALGKAPPNMSSLAPGSGSYVFQIKPVPAGCVLPACNLEGLVTIDRPWPYLQNGAIDYPRIGIAVGEVGPDGAYSKKNTPKILSGYSGGWSTDNPSIDRLGQLSGILAARFGYGTSGFSIFYKRDGSTPLTGDMNADAHAISGVTTLDATGKIKAKNFLTPVYNSGQSCDADEENAFGSSDAGSVMICRSRHWTHAQSNPAEPGAACDVEGITGTSASTGGDTLVCRGHVFVHLTNLIAHHVQVGRVGVQDNSLVGIPACDAGGIPDSSIAVTHSAIDVTTVPPMQAVDASVTPAGPNWLVSLKLIDTTNVRHSGNDYGLSAVLNLECRYQ